MRIDLVKSYSGKNMSDIKKIQKTNLSTGYLNHADRNGFRPSFGMALISKDELKEIGVSIPKNFPWDNNQDLNLASLNRKKAKANKEPRIDNFIINQGYPFQTKTILHNGVSILTLKQTNKRIKFFPNLIKELYLFKESINNELPAHFAGVGKLKEINRILKPYPEIRGKMYLTNSLKNKIPAHDVHGVVGAPKLKEIHNGLKDIPEVLAQMYTTKYDGKLLAHEFTDAAQFNEMYKALKNQPEVVAKILLTKGSNKKFPAEGRSKEINRLTVKIFKKLTIQTREVSDKKSVQLLESYKTILDENLEKVLSYLKVRLNNKLLAKI